jgi:hypothetical protein
MIFFSEPREAVMRTSGDFHTVRLVMCCLMLIAGAVARATPAASRSDVAWAQQKDADRWTDIGTAAVAATALPDSVPTDVAIFCAGYEGASRPERVHFWVGLIAAIARAETRFNPHDTFTEPFREKGADSPFVVSRGLLQLSFPGDRDRYHCDLPNAESLYDPAVNLTCGVQILATLVTRDRRLAGRVGSTWQGAAVYWSTLRSSGGKEGSNARNLAQITRATQTLGVCHVPQD